MMLALRGSCTDILVISCQFFFNVNLVGILPFFTPITYTIHICHFFLLFFLSSQTPNSFSLYCILSKQNANGLIIPHLITDDASTQPSLCYCVFGYSYYSQMKIQSRLYATGLQENMFYFIPLFIWKCYHCGLTKIQMHTLQNCSCIWRVVLNLGLREDSPNVNVPFKSLPLIFVCPVFIWNVWQVDFYYFFCTFQCNILNQWYIYGVQHSKEHNRLYCASSPHCFTPPRQLLLTVAVHPSRGHMWLPSLIEVFCSLGFSLASRDSHRQSWDQTLWPVGQNCAYSIVLEESFQARPFTWKDNIWGVWFAISAATL